MNFNFPSIYDSLNIREKKALKSVLKPLYNLDKALCLIWGGSTTIQTVKQPWTDIDFWLVMKKIGNTKQQLYNEFQNIDGLSFIYDAGYFPWLGELLSLFFFQNYTLSIDVGICDLEGLSEANPGPRPCFIWGKSTQITSRLKHQKYQTSPQQRMMKILVNLLKIRKSLLRGHIWNSIEYLSRARRELMGVLAKRFNSNSIYYIRPDRNVEDLIDKKYVKKLAETCPQYSVMSVVKCTSIIIVFCLDWIKKEHIEQSLIKEFKNLRNWFNRFINKGRY